MRKIYIEILWLLGVFALALIGFQLMFDLGDLRGSSDIDINIHDTYFVINSYDFFIPYFLLILMVVYLARIILHRFQNVVANAIFLLANSALLFLSFSISCIILCELRLDSINLAIVIFTLLLLLLEGFVVFKVFRQVCNRRRKRHDY